MKLISTLALSLACAFPLASVAQTPSGMDKAPANVKPAGTPSSEMERKQTTTNGDAPKYGQPGAADSGSMTKTSKAKNQKPKKGAGDTASGDVPTYPAKTPDGRQTSDSNAPK